MSQPAVKWGQVKKYFTQRGYVIKSKGGEKFIIAPKNDDTPRTRNSVRIGHKCCSHSGR